MSPHVIYLLKTPCFACYNAKDAEQFFYVILLFLPIFIDNGKTDTFVAKILTNAHEHFRFSRSLFFFSLKCIFKSSASSEWCGKLCVNLCAKWT